MKPLQEFPGGTYHDFLDFLVVDPAGEEVGTFYCAWSDQRTGKFEFIGVKSGWFLGKNHIIPAQDAQVDTEKKTIQIPYTAAFLKEAPVCDSEAEVTEEHERVIREYYQSK